MTGELEQSDSGNTQRSQHLAQLAGSVPDQQEQSQPQLSRRGSEQSAHGVNVSRRQSNFSAIGPTLFFERQPENNEAIVELLLATWPPTPPELERSEAALVPTNFRTMIEVSTTYITEKWVWLACHNEKFSTFSADGTASNFDSLEQLQRLHEMSLDLNTKYKHWRRHFFPPEVLESLVNYFERSPNKPENVEHWARNYGPWRDVMWLGYRCTACGKLRRMGLLYMEAVRLLIPPLMRRCSQLGVTCTQMATTQILHPTIEALTLQTEQLPPQLCPSIVSRGSQSVVVDIDRPTPRPSSQGSTRSTTCAMAGHLLSTREQDEW